MRAASARFSPLLIGEHRRTRRVPRSYAGDGGQFQSPPHRGTSSNDAAPAEARRVRYCFSPLLIGEHRRTLIDPPRSDRPHEFQSPPHRGTSSNRTGTASRPAPAPVSVPSSSGNIVELGALLEQPETWEVSVPSSSGNIVERGRQRSGISDYVFCFSPLLIGEHRRTPPRDCGRGPWRSVSVPSSSGNIVEPGCAGRGPISAPTSFSPLLIGEHRRTTDDFGVRILKYVVSVPSSSGNIVEPRTW